jgi:hypothetical protein
MPGRPVIGIDGEPVLLAGIEGLVYETLTNMQHTQEEQLRLLAEVKEHFQQGNTAQYQLAEAIHDLSERLR